MKINLLQKLVQVSFMVGKNLKKKMMNRLIKKSMLKVKNKLIFRMKKYKVMKI
jgi:hypothetical protein